MAYKTFTLRTDVNSVDITGMAAMSPEDYDTYIRTNLFFVDHHDVLREQPAGGYPIAVTKAQMQALLRYLQQISPTVGVE